jgi:citrate synthase
VARKTDAESLGLRVKSLATEVQRMEKAALYSDQAAYHKGLRTKMTNLLDDLHATNSPQAMIDTVVTLWDQLAAKDEQKEQEYLESEAAFSEAMNEGVAKYYAQVRHDMALGMAPSDAIRFALQLCWLDGNQVARDSLRAQADDE